MEIFDQPHKMREWSRWQRTNNSTTGCVPTMGALHDGHRRLIETALSECDQVIVTVFVNQLQFNNADDYNKYPRLLDADIYLCADLGVGALYCPSSQTMYPPDFETHVQPGSAAATMEGEFRPGHFAGVATVVSKLFNATEPDRAYFGAKDYQQLAVIKRMVIDLDMGIKIISIPTVRQPNGLALSSRNAGLSPEQNTTASIIYQGLQAANQAFNQGERTASVLKSIVADTYAAQPEARVEYTEIFDSDTLTPISKITDARTIMAVAVWFGDVRLIDNIEFTA
ncbi:MAG: pantoate--beta-alanine ligase [Ilumatobacteraceae bacterium]|nr:pantoate--beta-alanine ligase [Ilumatobacteraceae bacterium]